MPYLANDEIEVQENHLKLLKKKSSHKFYKCLYFIHSPVFPGSKLQKSLAKMEEFYDKKEGQLGISNCTMIWCFKISI